MSDDISEEKCRILVLCTGNSCRSIMAEALFNADPSGRFEAYSAGSHPTGKVHPGALATLERHGLVSGELRSQSWDEFEGEYFDIVLTVCDAAANETCPVFTGKSERMHWSIRDPAGATGSETQIQAAFEIAFQDIQQRIKARWP